jgi:hypothetical protein
MARLPSSLVLVNSPTTSKYLHHQNPICLAIIENEDNLPLPLASIGYGHLVIYGMTKIETEITQGSISRKQDEDCQ